MLLSTQVGADKQMTKRWLQFLAKEGLVSVVQAGQTVILNPSGEGFKQQVAEVLRRDDEVNLWRKNNSIKRTN
jgi:hypothetical protein